MSGRRDVENPPHYTYGKIECIDVIEDWKLPYHLACALKYICRAEHKGSADADIEKAIWYLKRHLDHKKASVKAVAPSKSAQNKSRKPNPYVPPQVTATETLTLPDGRLWKFDRSDR